jgi:hypothetical protein
MKTFQQIHVCALVAAEAARMDLAAPAVQESL